MSFLGDRIRRVCELRHVLAQMTVRDLQTQYAGSALGLLWSYVHPLVMALVLWYVFAHGFRAQPVRDIPFAVWLFCGLFPWTFYNTAVGTCCGSLSEQSFLVKRTGFCVALIPMVKIASAFCIHLGFLAILAGFALANGVTPGLHWLQLPYYTLGLCVLLVGTGWLVSSLNLFLRDVAQGVNVLLQLGFWLTPVFWMPETMPVAFTRWLWLNPMAYLVEGYRNSVLHGAWFWQDGWGALRFWCQALGMGALGLGVFRRLRPHFADVL